MNDLREDLDRALRTVTFSEAPIEQAKQRGRQIRGRRRAALVVGALAVAAVAAGYPALTRTTANLPPAPAGGHKTHDAVLTDVPGAGTEGPTGLVGRDGVIAVGTAGRVKWQATVKGPGSKGTPVAGDTCYSITSSPGGKLYGACLDKSLAGDQTNGANPVVLSGGVGDGAMYGEIGQAAADVTYVIVTFADGQQLKLIPVVANGLRYVAWVAPLSMTIERVDAHLGGPYATNGLIATAVPFDPPGQLPSFGLWQQLGQAAPPTSSAIIGSGSVGGRVWAEIGYEGPFGTCFTPGSDSADRFCLPVQRLGTTALLGGWGGNPPETAAFGSAAPGVALVRVTLSDGKTATARPVSVGNEDLFAFAISPGVTPTGWTAYDAYGHQVGTGTTSTGSASTTITLSP